MVSHNTEVPIARNKSLILVALMFAVDFFSVLLKELKKRNVTEEKIFDALKSKNLIPQMAEKITELIEGVPRRVLRYLMFVKSGISVVTSEFSTSHFVIGVVKYCVGEDFQENVLKYAPETIPAFNGLLAKFLLTKDMTDAEIRAEIGPETFSVSEVLAIIAGLASYQPNGNEGDLTSKFSNVFYVVLPDGTVVAVSMMLFTKGSDGYKWGLFAKKIDEFRKGEGSCVFFRDLPVGAETQTG